MKSIKFLVIDVDGTLTDGMIYLSENGELFKSFNIKDGYGIKDILPVYGIIPVIITARKSKILENRCKELSVKYLFQGIRDKLAKLTEFITTYNYRNGTEISLRNCAYIGDDILEIQCMNPIKEAGGFIGCPADAVAEVKELASFIAPHNGGYGAVRDFIDWLIKG